MTFARFSPDPFLGVTIEMSFGERRGAILLMKDNISLLAPCAAACSVALAAGSPVREWCLWLGIGDHVTISELVCMRQERDVSRRSTSCNVFEASKETTFQYSEKSETGGHRLSSLIHGEKMAQAGSNLACRSNLHRLLNIVVEETYFST